MNLSPLGMEQDFFTDEAGRRVILRGFNLGGDSKVPYPNGGTHIPTDFADHATVSFVGRPFPIAEADEHFARLEGWGCNVVRLLTTWEAVEHAGPGIYDNDYLEYFAEICRRAGEAGMYVLIDFHQDVWSRMSGGDGAPCWTFEKAGIDYRNIAASGSARVMQFDYDFDDPRPFQNESYPAMCWQNNNRLPAAGIMWILFFAGNDFAPGLHVDGVPIQEYLQEHYCAALREVARRVAHLPNVLGFDTLNEPGSGWIGVPMDKRYIKKSDYRTMPGIALSPVECLFAAQGNSVRAPELAVSFLRGGIVKKRYVGVNKGRIPLWLPGHKDPFLEAGAWEQTPDGSYRILKHDYFTHVRGRQVSFERDYYVPFAHRVAEAVRGVRDDWLLFANVDASRYYYEASLPALLPERTVNASHWYDGLTLITKKFHYPLTIDGVRRAPVFGLRGIKKMFEWQLARYKSDSRKLGDGAPTFLGEFGIPFNLSGGRAYRAWARGKRGSKIWKEHIMALDCVYGALDAILLHGTQWTYTATNRNDGRIGDTWNQEDFSVFSRDQQDHSTDPNSGGRACEAFVRPFARRTQGLPLAMRFDQRRGSFMFRFKANSDIPAPTELFVPRLQYPRGFIVRATGCDIREDAENQLVYVKALVSGEMTIVIERKRK